MATILFDKMRAARKLEGEGNFTRQQAETLSEVMHDSLTEGVATKADMDALSVDLKATEMAIRADMGLLKADLKAVEPALKADMGVLKSDLKAVESALKADMGLLRADMGVLRTDLKTTESTLKADLNARTAMLQAKIAESKTQIIIWVAGLMLASGVLQHFLH
jgi:hypothetical protein